MGRILPCLEPADRTEAIAKAVQAARNGRLVALPAESGYVLATDAFSARGVTALQQAKGLAPDTSLGLLVGSPQGVLGISARVTAAAQELIQAFWPGQFALILPMQKTLRWSVPTDRFVVRMPLHPVLLAVVQGLGPMAYSGGVGLDDGIADLGLDAGPRPSGPGSTVIDATVDPPLLVREGVVAVQRVIDVVPSLAVVA